MRRQEIIINILLILFSLGMIFWIIPAYVAPPQDYGLSGGTLPKLCCGVIVVLAVIQLLSAFRRGILPDAGRGINKEILLHVCKYFVPMFCIIPLWSLVGFLPGSIAVILVLLLIGGRRDYKLIIPVAVLLPCIIMLLLRYGLQVPTP